MAAKSLACKLPRKEAVRLPWRECHKYELERTHFQAKTVELPVMRGIKLRKNYASSVNLLENDERSCVIFLNLHNLSNFWNAGPLVQIARPNDIV